MKRKIEVLYAYKVDHDLGMNPNPFGTYCTLAYCKGTMRKSIKNYVDEHQLNKPELSVCDMGIWVIGIAGLNLNLGDERGGKLLYAMQVTEVLTFEEYWNDSRFEYKVQILNENERLILENGEDKKRKYSFWRNNKSRLVCGDVDTIFGMRNEPVLVSETFIYHGFDCRKQNEFL